MSNISKRKKDGYKAKIKTMGDHKEFLKRITKTLYYGELPTLPCLSLPVTEISCSLWSVSQRGRSLRRLHADAAADIARSACVSPCALVLAILYLERLKRCNPDYLTAAAPADLFLVSLMVSNKFLQDDGEDDEVICSEWAASGGLELDQLKKLEVEFLSAIDWNVFVSEKSFEAGLSWLEREVALKQAQARGFFTYGDLAAAGGAGAGAGGAARAAAAACAACLAALLALVASALVLAHSLPAPSPSPAPAPAVGADITAPASNGTVAITDYRLPEEAPASEAAPCCAGWSRAPASAGWSRAPASAGWSRAPASAGCSRAPASAESRSERYDGTVADGWKPLEPWWSRTSVTNWLYHISLVDPMQRWLEKTYQYADFFKKEIAYIEPEKFSLSSDDRENLCGQHCFRQWLNFSKLSVFVASVSDR